jgi:hypothetical protein
VPVRRFIDGGIVINVSAGDNESGHRDPRQLRSQCAFKLLEERLTRKHLSLAGYEFVRQVRMTIEMVETGGLTPVFSLPCFLCFLCLLVFLSASICVDSQLINFPTFLRYVSFREIQFFFASIKEM